ncbi:MAG: hypothetical protein ACOVPA_16390 [Rubrivivax sp.]
MLTSLLAAACIAVGCGGSDDTDPVTQLRLQADAAESRALALAPNAVCRADNECALIYFEDAFPSCTLYRAVPILAAAPSRHAAEMAAETQRALAREARHAPGVVWEFVCAAVVPPPPVPFCERSLCRVRPGEVETVTLRDD